MSNLFSLLLLVFQFCVIDSETSDVEGTCSTDYPVNIPEGSSLKYKAATSFKLEGFDDATVVLRKTSEGYAMDLEGELYVTGGGLTNRYKAVQITMLMDNSTIHLYNKRQFVMQVYLLSYNTKYANRTEATGQKDGLSALSFWVQDTMTSQNSELVPTFEELFKAGERTDNVKLRNIFPQYLLKFYQYHGKLGPMHPSCDVSWSISNDRLLIHKDQIQTLRSRFPTSQRKTSTRSNGSPTVTRNFRLSTESSAPAVSVNTLVTLGAVALYSLCIL
ncbi:carbonic anhydrase 4-like [Ylistrum balloti]|uniref:carbonic anhydrase 4-like n=1 Tax=Ylistrum balloti TaxID=509963 RepID=UPI002905C177|nr:carbonic anhydrase 4-like [Ylistrum balloti]